MRRLAYLALLMTLPLSACIIQSNGGGPPPPPPPDQYVPSPDQGVPPDTLSPDTLAPPPGYAIETGATLTYKPGMDAGYYLAYATGGHWRIDFTCDTVISGASCTFDGRLLDVASGGTILNAVGYDCDASVSPPSCTSMTIAASAGEIDWSGKTVTTAKPYEYFYITFDTSTAGDPVEFDDQIDGAYHPELTFWPKMGVQNPASIPFDLTPTTP